MELLRRPRSRGNALSSTSEGYNHEQERPGSVLKNLFSRTVSFKSSTKPARSERPILSREISSQLSLIYQGSMRSSSLNSEFRKTSLSTADPTWPRASWDPPPLFQAYPQALRQALLDSPSASVESILRHNIRYQTKAGASTTSTGPDQPDAHSAKTKKQKRGLSASLMCGWTRKLYILVRNGYILQYTYDGHHDRLPERILQLGHHSVAYASDAIPGRPYVLQICHDPNQEDEIVEVSTKSLWSRIGFPSPEEKRLASTFLLVCERSDELDAWMVAVRREIEAHGGTQCRSGTPHAHSEQPAYEDEFAQQFELSQSRECATERPKTGYTDSDIVIHTADLKYELLPKIKTLSAMSFEQPLLLHRDSSEGSSIDTATELDDLRDSLQSCNSTATGHHLSLDGSTYSLSPAHDKFDDVYTGLTEKPQAPVLIAQGGASPESPVAERQQARASISVSSITSSPQPVQQRASSQTANSRPVSGIPNFSLPTLPQQKSRCSLVLSERSSVAASEVLEMFNTNQVDYGGFGSDRQGARPTSTIAPLPSREAIVKRPKFRVPSVGQTCSPTSSRPIAGIQNLSPEAHVDQKDIKAVPQPAYTLFPKRYSLCDASIPIDTPAAPQRETLSIPVNANHHRSSSTPPDAPENLLKVSPPRRLRRPASMQIHLGGFIDVEKPERSPAVTDLHFATNFGIANPFHRSSSIKTSPRSTSVHPLELVIRSSTEPVRPTRRKAASSSAVGPPAGPPPMCPLPAPPIQHVRGSSVPIGLSSSRRIYLDLTSDDY